MSTKTITLIPAHELSIYSGSHNEAIPDFGLVKQAMENSLTMAMSPSFNFYHSSNVLLRSVFDLKLIKHKMEMEVQVLKKFF